VLQNDPAVGKATRLNTESTGLVQPFYDKVGLEILDDIKALVQVEMSDYVQNSFHTLNGGVVAFLSDLAGQTVARHVTGKPFVTTDLVIHFLRLGEVGPFQTRTSILRKTDETVLSFVEILDIGAGGRLVSIATNLATLDDLR
jgi:acyl-coenzyme A thioesterase PaaI-like protein